MPATPTAICKWCGEGIHKGTAFDGSDAWFHSETYFTTCLSVYAKAKGPTAEPE